MNPEILVTSWVSDILGSPFQWGKTDCVCLTLEALKRLTGENYPQHYEGCWDSEESARLYYEIRLPSEGLKLLGAEEVGWNFITFGDVITVPAPPWLEQVHFVLGRFCLCSDETRGVFLLPTTFFLKREGVKIWRVAQCLKLFP